MVAAEVAATPAVAGLALLHSAKLREPRAVNMSSGLIGQLTEDLQSIH
jgi:hypothetical protein